MYAHSSEPERMRVLFATYWHTLLLLASALVVGVFMYGGWQLMSIMRDTDSVPFDASVSSPEASTKTAQIDMVLQGFSARQARFDALRANTSAIADPSR